MSRTVLSGLVCIALLAACHGPSVQATPIVAPDGSHAFAIDCSGTPSLCWQAAGERCPGGYDTMVAGSHDGWAAMSSGDFAKAGSYHVESMMVRCHGAAAPDPEPDVESMSNMELGAYYNRKAKEKDAGR